MSNWKDQNMEGGDSFFLKIVAGTEVKLRFFGDVKTFHRAGDDGPKQRAASLVLLREPGKDIVWTPKLWEFGVKVFRQLRNFANQEDWGDPTGFDVVVKREGAGMMDTTYFVTPIPPKPLSEAQKAAIEGNTINLDAVISKFSVNAPEPEPEGSYSPFEDE